MEKLGLREEESIRMILRILG